MPELRPSVSLSQLNPAIFWSALTLVCIGFVMVTSASLHVAAVENHNAFYFAKRQAAYLLLGLTLAGLVYAFVSTALLRLLRIPALVVAFLVLLVVLVPGVGVSVNGARRWINLGLMNVQASEIVKLCFVIYLAGYIEIKQRELKQSWEAFVGPMLVLVFLALFLLMEPDFGATMVVALTAFGMLFMAGVKARYFATLISMGAAAATLLVIFEPYRMKRLVSFLDPWSDQFGSGYQLTQSLIAFGRGHWSGVGLGHGVQKLFYLPEAHTDFVFAVLAEELGLLGVVFVLGLFVLMGYALFRLSWQLQQQDKLHCAMLVLGFGMVICTQVVINMGVTMGALPTKGLTLPLVSYGGSSLVVSLVMLAIILRVAAEARPAVKGGNA